MYELFTGRDAAVGRMNYLSKAFIPLPLVLVNFYIMALQVAQW